MLHKESAIAVMVAVMLGAASLFGGLAITPALATHDSDAVELATEEITQEDDESVIIDAVELDAKKLTSRVMGTVTVEIIQDGERLESASFGMAALKTSFSTVEVDVTNINVTGSFEILAEFVGSGVVTVNDMDIVEGTEVAEDGGNGGNDDSSNENENPAPPPQEEVLENVIAKKTIAQDDDESTTVEVVEFDAKKLTSRVTGTVTVALVQDNVILDQETFSTSSLKTSFTEREATFDEEITGDFDVVFMYEGSGVVSVNGINVPGATEPAEEPPVTAPNPEDTIQLLVNSINQNNEPITGLWVALLQGMTVVDSGETEVTFTLNSDEDYIVEMGDYYDEASGSFYDFNGWDDSTASSRRPANDLTANQEFTAKYIVTTGAPPPPGNNDQPTTSPPPSSAPGTITTYAYRIPHEEWGPTFVSADAQMYFVLYNSAGAIVYTEFFDENGHTITGLNEGETYWISPTDCHHCHGGTHDVVFHHWDDGSTERQRPVTTGMSAGVYYEYVPDTP
jgi:hypothetical protein